MLTLEEKEQRKAERQALKKAKEETERTEAEKNQKEVKSIKINIEWKKSRMWGNNPHLEAWVSFRDGTGDYYKTTCSGCGYDKESTVISDVFNAYLKYKLYQVSPENAQIKPYGVYLNPNGGGYFDGGIGTECYRKISEFIGGEFKSVASGRSFDAYEYIEA